MHGQLCTASVKNKFLSSPICLPSNMLMYSLISQFNFQMPVYFLLSKNLIITPTNFILCHYSIFQDIFLVLKKRRDASKTTFVSWECRSSKTDEHSPIHISGAGIVNMIFFSASPFLVCLHLKNILRLAQIQIFVQYLFSG